MMMARHGTNSFTFLIFLLCLVMPCMAITYTVGDQIGWATGIDYTIWASDKTFLVGDELVFNCGSDHTLDEVNPDDYAACTLTNTIASYNGGGLITILLDTRGTRYFTSGFTDRCSSGMKLTVTVLEAEGGATAAAPPLPAAPSNYVAASPSPPVYGPPMSSGTTLSPFVVVLIIGFAFSKLVLF